MTSAIGSRGTLAGSTCIDNGGLATRVAGLVTDATAGWIGVGGGGAGVDSVKVTEGEEKNWGGS